MKELIKYLLESAKAGNIDKTVAAKVVMALSKNEKGNGTSEYAIVGMDGEFALGENLEQYRSILKNGIDCVRDFPMKRQNYAKKYLNYMNEDSDIQFVKGGFLENIADFDYEFFGISPAEAKLMDPNQRRFLQAAWNCLEDAGYGAGQLNGKNVGVFAGYDNSSVNEYRKLVSDVAPETATLAMTGNIIPVIASRISYINDYHGPSSIFDTACSSAGVALYFACLAIESGECDSALVGSSRICMIPALMGTKVGVEAGDWKAKAFDDSADGTGAGEGVGVIYIKKLKDAIKDKDDIYCVIKGVYANCDGDSNGITAPNPYAQASLISGNIKKSGIAADSLSYFEAHGTGTKLGDPIEIEGIAKAIGANTSKKQFCAIGSSKTNLGHLDHASTMASIMKCVLSLKNKELYPSLNFNLPNRLIDFSDTPVYLNTKYRHWDTKENELRRCAINSFGLSGTNVNIILEEYKGLQKTECDRVLPITISAKSKKAFEDRISEMIYYFENSDYSFADICYTAFLNEGKYKYKSIVFASNKEDAARALSEYKENAYNTINSNCIDDKCYKDYIENIKDSELKKFASDYFSDRKLEFEFPSECHRVHIPVYQFQKIRCILEIPDVEETNLVNANKKHNNKARTRKFKDVDISENIEGCDSDLVQQMANIWCGVLGTEKVTGTDNFYMLGGDSIFAMRFIAEVKECFEVELSIKDALMNPTFESVTKLVAASHAKDSKVNEADSFLKNFGNVSKYEMTNSQKEMFIVQMMNPESTAYNMFNEIKVKGNFDEEEFLRSLNKIIARQDAIRTNYEAIDGHYMAVVRDAGSTGIKAEYFEIDSLDNQDAMEKCVREFIRPFDLQKDTLIRIGFVKTSESKDDDKKELAILFDMHHIACDGMSTGVLIRQICAEYFKLGDINSDVQISYSDYAMSVNEFEKTENYKSKEDALVEKLSGAEVLKLPTDYPRNAIKQSDRFKGNKISIDLSLIESDHIRQFVRNKNITAFQYFLSMFQVLLAKYTGQNDIVVGVPISGRNDVRLQNLIGLFINTVAIRQVIDWDSTCSDYLKAVTREVIDTYDKQCVSFPKLVERLGIQRDINSGHNPVFDVMFSMQNFEHEIMSFKDVEFTSIPVANEVSKLDVTLNISEHDNLFNLEIEYSTGLFTEDTIRRMLDNYNSFLKQCVNEPDKKLEELKLSDEELNLLSSVEVNRLEYDESETVKACIEKSVEKYDSKTAIAFDNQTITYRELNGKANYLVNILLQEKGLKKGDRVAILCRRSIEMMIAMLACVKAGVTYLPLDPEYPEDRLRYILKDSDTKCVIRFKADKIWEKDQDLVNIQDILLSELQLEEFDNIDSSFESDTPMYMIYTSGTTGLPKGVTITQGNVRNFILGMNADIPFSSDKKIISVTTIGFDIFVLESFMALSNGMEILIADEDRINDMDELCLSMINHDVDVLQTTPSRIRAMMISDYFVQAVQQLKLLLVGGEPLPKDFLDIFKEYDVRLFNVYGPTETTVWSTVGELTGSTEVHVGRPIANTKCIIVDAQKRRVPLGSVGELAIGGHGVAVGYHNRDELNLEKFVELNDCDGKFFMTGDLARWNHDRNIIIVGRNDRMVKYNGYRIELDEIQSVIVGLDNVKEASVFITANNLLIACVSANSESVLKPADIQGLVKNKLPNYMLPNKIIILDELPHTPNGKLNNKELRAMADSGELFETRSVAEETIPKSNSKPTNTEMQAEILNIWQQLLNNTELGVDDDIFEYGANSLKVIEFLALVKKKGLDIVINEVFSNPTVEKLEAYLINKKKINLLRDVTKIENLIFENIGINVRISSLIVSKERKVIYAVESLSELDDVKKKELFKLISDEVYPEYYATHFADMKDFIVDDKKEIDIEEYEALLNKANSCEIDVVSELLEECESFERKVLSSDIEKEYRMAAIQHYFLNSERYSGTMISFNNLLDIQLFNKAITEFVNEQGLFRADVVRHGNKLFFRQREEVRELEVPFADLSMYLREVQFSVVNDICQNIYFKEYAQIRDLYGESQNAEFEGLLYRMLLIKIAENEYYLILPVNHAIFDAMSGEVVKRRILNIYRNICDASDVTGYVKPYEDFVDQTRSGPINISEEELETIFEIERYSNAVEKLEEAISVYTKDNSTYIRLEIKDSNRAEDGDDNAWSIAFEALRLFAKDYLGLVDMPFMIYYYGRKYAGEEYFDTVGEFIDMIPMTASVEQNSPEIQLKTQEVIGNSEKYNVNFSTFALHQGKKYMDELEKKVDEINAKTSIVFNFQGKLEKGEMTVFESFLYDRLMYELNNEEARNIHVMTRYSNDKIQLDINLPFEVKDNSIEEFFKKTGLLIINYEQKIIVSKI